MKLLAIILGVALPGIALGQAASSPPHSSLHPRAAAAAARVRPALERDLEQSGLKLGAPVFIRAFKEERQVELFLLNHQNGKFQLFRIYPIAAASGQLGPKLLEGDGQVPEGFYSVGPKAMKPDSRYHLAFNLGYPNAYDRAQGRTGGLIMVHGNQVSIGCLAMTDAKIEEIYTLCGAAHAGGQGFFRAHVFPFRMSAGRMKQATGSKWEGFWKNLQEGYDWFETRRVPPDVTVRDSRYHFGEGK